MAKFNIISHNGAEKCWGEPRYEGSYMGVSSLKFTNISSPYPIKWQIGDFVGYYRNGMRFSLYSIPEPIKQANTGEYGAAYVYPEVVLYAPTKELETAPFRDIVSDDNGIHFSSRPEVSTYEDVYGIARRIQSCMDDLYPGKWVIRVLDTKDENLLSTFREARAFSVSDGTCLDALSTIYDVWENIGWIYESNGVSDVITIGGANERTESNTTDAFAYGKDNGLTSLKKIAVNEGEFATRLYVYGSERNIPPRYYNSQQIKDAESVNIPNLMIPMSEWGITDGLPDPRKAYIQADEDIISKYGLIPRTIRFDGNQNKEIFPSVEGLTEKQVRDAMIAMGQGGSEYLPPASDLRIDEVYGSYIPDDNGVTINTDGTLISGAENLPSTFQLEINSIGFDPMQQASLANEKNATLSFKSGKCAGRDFPIVKAVWNYGTWLLELERQVDDSLNIAFPNKDYPIVKGDQFAVLNIAMPQYYVTLAEKRMIEEGRKVLADYTRTSATYEPSIDPIKAHKEGWILKEGMYMKVYDRDIVDTPDNYDYILIDSISIDEASDIALYNVTLYDQKRSVSGLDALEGMIEDTNKGAAKEIARTRQFTERRFRSAEETLEMLAKAIEGYTEGISPITVRTMAMLVGNEALQYRFTSSRNSLVEIPCPISWDSSTQRVKAEASALAHLTLGVNEITTEGRRAVSSYKRWSIAYQNSEAIEDTEARYVYLKASKSDYSSTKLILSKDAISMEEESGYYHFLVGILNSENDGSRDFVTLYGFTEILPGQITTDVIRSADGDTYFDLANSEIGGRITFASGSSGLMNLSEWSGVQSQIDKANEDALKAQEEAEKAFNAQKAFAEQTTKDLEGLQDQIDGNITSWFYDGVPTLSNAPAKDWSTTDLKNNHLGDLYYDQNSGKAYRFQMNGTTYEWKLIADEDITKALELAGDAQDTADAKRRVFFGTSTPTGEKDKGDLWTNGTDLYVWNGTSWEKATKYTDDTTANAAISIAETAQNVANTASANATNAASLANDAKALAETAKGAAEEAEELIETANNYAKEAKEAAESSENAAKLSQQAAETAQQAVEDGQITVDESKRIAEDAKAASDAAQEASKEAEEAAIAAQQAAQAAQNLADEAKADAEKAAQDAEQAASDAKNASDRLDEWADDALVSPSDIPAIENELVYITADKTDIDAQLEIYAIDNEDTISDNFNTAYNAYEDALNAVLKLEIGTTFPEDLDDKQTAYYTQRTVILEAIAKAAKKVADDAQKTADDANAEAGEAAKTAEEAKQNAEDALLAAQNAEAASQEAQQAAAAAQAKANEVSEKIDGDNYFTEIEKKTIRSIIAEITECREKLHENNAIVKFTTKQGHSWYLVKEDSYAEWTDANEEDHSVSQSKYAGYYSSNLHNANSYSVTQVDVELTEGREVDIQLDYFSDAESTNDWMTVGARGMTVSPANTTTTSNTLPNRAGSTYGKQRMVFSKVYNITQEVDAEKRYFQVAYKKNATIDVGTDSAYFRISNPHYIDESGSLHIIELKGSFHSYYLLLKQKGYTEVADMLYDALTEILGLLNANGLWTSGTTELTDGVTFRATLNEYLTDYYAILASCGFDIMDSKLADFDYLAGALKDGSKTLTDGGLIMTSLVAVGDTSTTNADVEAFMNGSDFCEDNEHGKLIHAMGIPRSVTEEGTEYTDLEKRSKAANTRIYEDGTIISKNAELNEGCVIGGTVKVTANGIEVDAPDAWGKLTISDQFGLRRRDGKLDVQIGGSCAGAGLNISNGTPAHGVCYVRGSEGYVCATFATTPGKRAIDIFDGMIGGMRPNTVFKSSGETLTHLDHTCFAASGSIYLPSDPQIGQNYRIIHTSSSGLRVMIGTGDYTSTFKNIGSLTIDNLYIVSNKIEMIELIYDGSNWWYMTSRND